jgi:hypothetical protein
MKTWPKIRSFIAATCLVLGLSVPSVHAFSLLGPFEPWMEYTNGLRQVGDIGGPMCISNEYRWNVPVVTYGFDQSFLDYFGMNGVAAVDSAIQILNDLPPASSTVLTNFPLGTTQENYAAQAQSLLDLKSFTLWTLLEQLGITTPTRYIYVLRQWDPVLTDASNDNLLFSVFYGTNISDYVVARNYDPQSLNASPYVNEILYSAYINNGINQYSIIPYSVDPLADSYNAVADFNLGTGGFYTGLTYDDVGGLAYLLSTNNINYEPLLPSIYGAGTNADSFVNAAWRPGVDKITFVPQPVDTLTGEFLPMTNQFTDIYITNGNVMQQQVERVVTQPDFLFCAGDINYGIPSTATLSRTGTTNWINNAALNGNPGGAGPGVIQPQVKITFNKLGRTLEGSGTISDVSAIDWSVCWATFDGSTNAPIVYPMPQTGTNQMTVRMWLVMGSKVNNHFVQSYQNSFDWSPISPAGTPFAFQTSTNLTDWVTIFSVTNNSSVSTYINQAPSSKQRFYRLIPQ